jgi:glycosyltransferase involved in cell wall biosynthesis
MVRPRPIVKGSRSRTSALSLSQAAPAIQGIGATLGYCALAALSLLSLLLLFPIVAMRQWWRGWHPLPPPGPPPYGGRLVILIPVRNEAATIGPVVAAVPRAEVEALGFEPWVVVVDDGSTDGSGVVARTAGADEVIRHAQSLGLGAAVRTGLTAARLGGASAAVYLDGDGEYQPRAIPQVAGPVLRGEADYVLGSRFLGRREGMRLERTLGNIFFTALTVGLTGRWLTDGQTGYRAFSRRALEGVEIIHDYNYAQVLTLGLLKKGMRMAEVPIDYRAREMGTSFIRGPEYCGRVLFAIVRQLLRP